MDNRYLAAGGVGALVIAAVVGAFLFLMPKAATTEGGGAGTPSFSAALAPKATDIGLGDPKAPIRFVEYASMDCPHCGAFTLGVMPAVKKKWIDTGKVYYVMRDFPLHDQGAMGSMVARCLPKEQFYPFLDLLFANQKDWVQADDPKEALITLSHRAGLSREKVESCLKDQAMLDRINASRDEATAALGVNSTPTLFVNGEQIVGAPTLSTLEEKFTKLLPAS